MGRDSDRYGNWGVGCHEEREEQKVEDERTQVKQITRRTFYQI